MTHAHPHTHTHTHTHTHRLLDIPHWCCLISVNRRAALSLGAVDLLLARISTALQLTPLPSSVEPMLLIVEQLVAEANKLGPQASDGAGGSAAGAGERIYCTWGEGRGEECGL